MEKDSKILVLGYKGLVGSAITRALRAKGYTNLLLVGHADVDLTRQDQVERLFAEEKPEYVILAAAKVGGILANSRYPAEFIYINTAIALNVIHSAWTCGVKKLLNLGSSCIYPRLAPQPMAEDALLTSELEKTNEAYALAKITAIKLCRYYNQQYGTNYISVMPTNLYGAGDNFNMETAHLLPMIMRRFHLAKLLAAGDYAAIRADLCRYKLGWGLDAEAAAADTPEQMDAVLAKVGAFKDKVVLWGDGSVYREMMCSDDMADACVYLMENKDAAEVGEFVNITGGTDIQLRDLFEIVKRTVGFAGRLEFDATKPNGTPRKLMDATRIRALGWQPKISLEEGVRNFYAWYCGGVA